MKLLGEEFIITPEKRNKKLFYKLIFGDNENMKVIFQSLKLQTAKDGYTNIIFNGIDSIEMRIKGEVANLIKDNFDINVTEPEEEPEEPEETHRFNFESFPSSQTNELRDAYLTLGRENRRLYRIQNSWQRRVSRRSIWERFLEWADIWKAEIIGFGIGLSIMFVLFVLWVVSG